MLISYTAYLWTNYGLTMEYLWSIYGVTMDYPPLNPLQGGEVTRPKIATQVIT